MSGCDALDLQVLGGVLSRGHVSRYCNIGRVMIRGACREGQPKGLRGITYACKLKNLGSEILQNGCDIDCCLGADAHLVLRVLLEETLDTATWELVPHTLAYCTPRA